MRAIGQGGGADRGAEEQEGDNRRTTRWQNTWHKAQNPSKGKAKAKGKGIVTGNRGHVHLEIIESNWRRCVEKKEIERRNTESLSVRERERERD